MQTSTYSHTLHVVASIRDGVIQATIAELREQDRLTLALRSALKIGISIDDLSEASGLTPAEIRRRTERTVALDEDLDALTGVT